MVDAIQHDSQRWGSNYTNEITPREVTRLADVVRLRTNPAMRPVRLAAADVVQILAKCAPSTWFMFERGDAPKALGVDDLWCRPRGMPDTGWNRIDGDNPWAQFDADPELVGFEGAIACLRETWRRVTSEEELDQDLAGRVAILKTDAERLFGINEGAALHQLQIATSSWTAERLLARREELGAAKPAIKAPTQQLVEESGLTERTIQRRIKDYKSAKDAAAKPSPFAVLLKSA